MLRNFPPKTSESTFSKLEVVSCEELLFSLPLPPSPAAACRKQQREKRVPQGWKCQPRETSELGLRGFLFQKYCS